MINNFSLIAYAMALRLGARIKFDPFGSFGCAIAAQISRPQARLARQQSTHYSAFVRTRSRHQRIGPAARDQITTAVT